jgi:serine/threonine-protein kinase
VSDSPIPEFAEFEQRLKETLSSAYNIERELGGGGMSRVFVATDRILGRKIVIKVLSPELTAEVNRGRFRREIQVAAQLQHPHIVPLLSAGEQEDLLYFTMPFIKGESLKTAVEKDGGMSVNEVLRVLTHVGEALDYAHEAGIVHRDIKPANILRSGSYAMITDFGVAKALNAAMPSQGAMTQTGMAIGTPAYMAPEQLAGDAAADHRIDIYAVGLMAYELLYGKSPFAGTTPQRMLAAVLTMEPKPLIDVRPDVPQWLSDVVMQCLSKEPNERPSSAKELLSAMDTNSTTVSGEIRTMEQRVPHIVHSPTPTSGSSPVVTREDVIPVLDEPSSVEEPPAEEEYEPIPTDLPTGEVDGYGYRTPKKSRMGMYAGIVAVLAILGLVGFFMSQRGSSETPVAANVAPPLGSPLPTDSITTPLPGAPAAIKPESTTTVAAVTGPKIDSTAIKDSLRKARREAQKKAIAQAESLRLAQEAKAKNSFDEKARVAVGTMLVNASALKKFNDGATHMGGVLGSKRKGDLQTQIDALQPFLLQQGLTWPQFKDLAAKSGINVFDEFGRMTQDGLKRFAGSR